MGNWTITFQKIRKAEIRNGTISYQKVAVNFLDNWAITYPSFILRNIKVTFPTFQGILTDASDQKGPDQEDNRPRGRPSGSKRGNRKGSRTDRNPSKRKRKKSDVQGTRYKACFSITYRLP